MSLAGDDGEGGGGPTCEMVLADTTDLTSFVEAGEARVGSLRVVFDSVATARSRVVALVGGDETPPARAARSDGGRDPLDELIAEARLSNSFVAGVRDALATESSTSTAPAIPAELIDRSLADAGLAGLGPDRSIVADRRLAEELTVRRELAEVLTGLADPAGLAGLADPAGLAGDVPDHIRTTRVGLALEDWLGSLAGAGPERVAAAARIMIDRGIEQRAGLPSDEVGSAEGAVAAMLITQGVLVWPGDRAELVDELTGREVATTGDDRASALSLLVDALDLERSNGSLDAHGLGVGEWQRANQPWVRDAALVMLLQATIGPGGTITEAGHDLANDVLDRYPQVVELAGSTWHHTGFAGTDDRYRSTSDGRACRVWPVEGIRTVLGQAVTAPNHGLAEADLSAAATLDHLDARLAAVASDGQADFDRLWLERHAVVDRLADGDVDVADLIDRAMARGLTAAEALRLTQVAAEPAATNDRVRRIRVVYPTTTWGDPVPPDRLDLGERADRRLPADVARSLAAELGVLQNVQMVRFGEDRPVPEPPLTSDQVDLIRRYDDVAAWFHHRFAWADPGGAEAAVDRLAGLDREHRDAAMGDRPDGFDDLVVELARPENQIVWDLMAGAAGNDTFLGPGGAFRPPEPNRHVTPGDARALLVQLALHSTVSPIQADLDADDDGTVHEDELARWLDTASGDGSIPPVLIDRVRLGAEHGLGHDTFGWEEIGEAIGWIGLTAAAAATVAYSGGAAAPLWVQAGLAGLAGLEAIAYVQADDPMMATLAAAGALADLAAAARLMRLARAEPVPIGATAGIAAEHHHAHLVDLARRSHLPELNALADRADQLTPAGFLTRCQDIIDRYHADLARRAISEGGTPAQASTILRGAGLEIPEPRWITGDEPFAIEHIDELDPEALAVARSWGMDDRQIAEAMGAGARTRAELDSIGEGLQRRDPPIYDDLATLTDRYRYEQYGRSAAFGPEEVTYLTDVEREMLRVDARDGLLVDAGGRPIDTAGATTLFSDDDVAIYVMGDSGQIYVSNFQAFAHFHHSSILAGEPVAAAGEIVVRDGRIVSVNRRSGHYRPENEHLNQFRQRLADLGFDTSTIEFGSGL